MTGRPQPALRAGAPPVLAAAVLALAALLPYSGSFRGPFFFDDVGSITENPTIRHLGDLGAVLSPPSLKAAGVTGRPLVNLSLAVNYALGGLDPWGYHAMNLAIHVASALALLGILRLTLEAALPAGSPGRRSDAAVLAFASALLWTVHPLQTESVTSIVQRTESLMGLSYLLTLYAFIRYAGKAAGAGGWAALSVLCCLLGMAAKEVMVTAPVIVLLYDRTFVSGSLREAWRRHGRIHLALAATWILLAVLVARLGAAGAPRRALATASDPGATCSRSAGRSSSISGCRCGQTRS